LKHVLMEKKSCFYYKY